MTKLYAHVLAPLALSLTLTMAWGQTPSAPETVVVQSGAATLHAMLWRPQGRGPFPAVLLNHGSGRTGTPRAVRAECRNARSALRSSWLRVPIPFQTRCRAFH